MTTLHPNALAIARKITERKPTTECALGHGLHEARIAQEAELLQRFCQKLVIDMGGALQSIENGLPLANPARMSQNSYA